MDFDCISIKFEAKLKKNFNDCINDCSIIVGFHIRSVTYETPNTLLETKAICIMLCDPYINSIDGRSEETHREIIWLKKLSLFILHSEAAKLHGLKSISKAKLP